MDTSRRFYVYALFRPNGVICWIGKGSGYRWRVHERDGTHNGHLEKIIAKSDGELPKIKIRENLTEDEAHQIERTLIVAIGRRATGGPLVNFTDGGEGISGYSHTKAAKVKIGSAHKGRIFSEDTRKSMSKSAKKRVRGPLPEKTKAAISAALKGRLRSDSHKANIRAARRSNKDEFPTNRSLTHAEKVRKSRNKKQGIYDLSYLQKLPREEINERMRVAKGNLSGAPLTLAERSRRYRERKKLGILSPKQSRL